MKCLTCQTEFKPKSRKNTFCSNRCRITYHRLKKYTEHPEDITSFPIEALREIKDFIETVRTRIKSNTPITQPEETKPPPGLTGIELTIWKAEQKTK